MSGAPEITEAAGDADIAAVRALFEEYARSLDFDLCFQGFTQELAGLPATYAPPDGRLLLARTARRSGWPACGRWSRACAR